MAPKILVVDDEPSIVKLVTASLSGRGYEIFQAYDGQEAIVQAKLHKPDLILLDVMMPRMDGTEARKRLLADPETKDIPVIHLTAVGDFDKQREALADGATDYIVKPFAPSDLAHIVADMLDPKKREAMAKERAHKSAHLRAITDIMHRERK
ncbi:MAG TPA: response regulator [Coriobacteriia bacterium]